MNPLIAISVKRGGEEEDVEGSTSTNDCDTIVIDTINHVDNDYAFAEAVVVGINPLMLQTVVPLGAGISNLLSKLLTVYRVFHNERYKSIFE